MFPVEETDHVGSAQALVIEQFRNRTVVKAYLAALGRRCQELETVFWDIINKRHLDDAVDGQLDTLGRLVLEERLGRDDDEYRNAIRLRIRVNRSRGRIVDVIDVAALACAPNIPRITEYRHLGFEVEAYEQIGERHIATLLGKTRAAASYGILTISDLPKSSVLVFDDAVSPVAGTETFSDAVSGTGKVACSGYGLPIDFTGITITSSAAPTVASVNKSGYTRTQGGIKIRVTGTGFVSGCTCTIGGSAATVTFVNATTIDVITPALSAGSKNIVVTNPDAQTSGTSGNGLIEFVDPTSIFGGDLERWYSQTYAAGVWTDVSGGGNTSQGTAGKRPAASTLAGTADRPATHVALLFDGTDDGLNMGGAADLVTAAGTFAAVVEASSTQNAEANILAKNYTAEEFILAANRTPDAANAACFGCGGSTTTELSIAAATINDDTVHRLIGTTDAATARLYIDGAAAGDTGAGAIAGGSADFNAIGCAMSNAETTTDFHFTGKIAEVVIASVQASATQRAKLDAYLRDCAGQSA